MLTKLLLKIPTLACSALSSILSNLNVSFIDNCAYNKFNIRTKKKTRTFNSNEKIFQSHIFDYLEIFNQLYEFFCDEMFLLFYIKHQVFI